MPVRPRRNSRPATPQDYQLARIFLWALLLVGPTFIFIGVRANYRDRPSLQWPVTTGTVLLSELFYHGGKHSYYDVDFTYSYVVGNRHYLGHKIKLWNPNLNGNHNTVKNFVADYARGAQMDVHYNPQHPEDAVLFPGADEFGNRLAIWCGSVILVLAAWLNYRGQPTLAKLIAQKRAKHPSLPKAEPNQLTGVSHAFVTYEPGCKRKLNCFEDKECLLDALGAEDDGIQDWKPEDRVIDSAGREYRLVPQPSERRRYNIEPTGHIWSHEKLLDLAVADARLLKRDENALRRRVTDAPVDKRMAVLMKCVDELPAGPRWAIISLILFLVLFFVAVFFGTYKLVTWFQR